jgi:23S rRNA (cytidine1920-2'-O)/16S rRNA (cytidine1409-2'-O)-methyltransferase
LVLDSKMMAGKRVRLDKLLVDLGHFESRERAQRSILAGQVLVNERVSDKPGQLVLPEAPIRVVERERYVSRGGRKLEAALEYFGIDPAGWRCLDIGASTGGFTDCLLQHGAAAVVAVDVGRYQIDWKLRSDPRVTTIEGVNARYLTAEQAGADFDLAVADLSFISLTLVLDNILSFVGGDGEAIVLIKPQFELDPQRVGKGGIVRQEADRLAAIEKIRTFVVERLGREWRGVVPSPILGAKGNREYLACLR